MAEGLVDRAVELLVALRMLGAFGDVGYGLDRLDQRLLLAGVLIAAVSIAALMT